MNLLLVSVIVIAVAGVFATRLPPGDAAHPALPQANRALVIAACVVVVAAFVLQLRVVDAAALAQRPLPAWLATLTIRVIDDRAPLSGHAPFGDLDALAAALETCGLIALFAALRDRSPDRIARFALALALAGMLASAYFAPAMMSFDLYAYAGTVHGGLAHAYHPVRDAFARDWHVVNIIYGDPIFPSAYGPVWVALSFAATSWIASLSGTIAALRGIEVVAFVACIAMLRGLRVPIAGLALFALNPAILSDSIVAGHNDLTAVAFVLGAASVRTRSTFAAIVLAACAGAIKLPFLIVAPLAFVLEDDTRKRIGYALATLALGLGISAAFGGTAYLSAIRRTATIYDAIGHGTTDTLRTIVLVVILASVTLALVRRRFSPTLAWAFCALGITFSSWYLVWGIPYALAERRWFAIFLISLPGLAYLFATAFAPTDLSVRTFYFAAGLAPAIVALTLIRMRRTA